jgi:protein SCO1/2
MTSTPPTEATTGRRAQRVAARLAARPLFWALVVLAISGFQIVRAVSAELPALPPVLGTLPAFELTDQRGKPFGSAQLRHRVWIANFIFTRCPTVCPVFTQKMAKVQDRVKNVAAGLHLVSFSVDPDHDTPEVLAAYAKQHRASPRMWSWLTGAPEAVRATVRDGLKIAMERQGTPDADVPDILHGTHFVLVDQQLRIRGYYDSNDPEAVDRMMKDVNTLVNRPNGR